MQPDFCLFTFTIISAIVSGIATVVGFIFTTVLPAIFSVIAFIFTTVVPAIISGIAAVIAFLTPIAVAVGTILLKVLLVVAVVTLIIFAIWRLWRWASETFPEFIQGVKDFFKGLWDGIKATWNAFIEASKMAWDWLRTSATAAWSAATEAWDWLYNNIGELVTWVGEMFSNTWAWLEGVPYVGEVFKWMRETFFDLGANLKELFFGGGPFIERFVNFLLDTQLIQDLAAVGEWIIGGFKTTWDGLVTSLTTALEWWSNVFQSAWETLYSWMGVIYEWVAGKVEKVGEAISIASEQPELLVDTAERLIFSPWESLKTAANFWFGSKGGIVDDTTMAFIGEAQHPEMVIPLNSQGMNFLAKSLVDADVFGSAQMVDEMSKGIMNNLNQSKMINQTVTSLYDGLMINEQTDNMNAVSNRADSNSLSIVRQSDSEAMEIPFADFSAEVAKAAQEGVESQGTVSVINQIDSKLSSLAKAMKRGSGGGVTTPIVDSGTRDTSNYVDMVAKGIIGS